MDVSNNKSVLALFKRYLNPPTKKAPSERRGSKDQSEGGKTATATTTTTKPATKSADPGHDTKKDSEKEQVHNQHNSSIAYKRNEDDGGVHREWGLG